jgi:O-acetyl-ADP-ribose deacetylase (regulator of RNase III)
MPLKILKGDITKINADVIVNSANAELRPGGGVCGAIFRKAGRLKLKRECEKHSPISVGQAVITPSFKMKNCKYIIHTAAPKWGGGLFGEEKFLRECYKNSLELAVKNNCKSIAFPLISGGIYGYPKGKAFAVAKFEIDKFLEKHDINVFLILYKGELR